VIAPAGETPLTSIGVFDASGSVIVSFEYPAGGFPSAVADRFGPLIQPLWDPSGTRLLIPGRIEQEEIVWLADVTTGELTELHRGQVQEPAAVGDAWISMAFGP
jgi:hypothetical protein